MTPHPDRVFLHNEIHARPRQPVATPQRVSHIALLRPRAAPQAGAGTLPANAGVSSGPETQRPGVVAQDPVAALGALCAVHGLAAPLPGASHFYGDFGRFRLKWERHGEFDDYTVYCSGCRLDAPFSDPALSALPADWVAALPGELIAAIHAAVVADDAFGPDHGRAALAIGSPELVGSAVADAAGRVYTDLRLGPDGFSRVLLVNEAMSDLQAGRELQRVFEIEVYRMMAMLAFPIARRTAAELDVAQARLGLLASRLEQAPVEEEPTLLREITALAATVERIAGEVGFRFSAARAYHALVRQRGEELGERRLGGLQTLTSFLERRFDPAMAFCDSVSQRVASTSERIGRASSLLRTRVEIERERQNQEILGAMNRRALLQLRLQETLEGFSVAAITYYATGLVSYLFKAAKGLGVAVDVELATGLSVIPIALFVALGVRQIRAGVRRRLATRGPG